VASRPQDPGSALAALPAWDLSQLLGTPAGQHADRALAEAAARAALFASRYRGRVVTLTPAELACALRAYESCQEPLDLVTAYAELLAADRADDHQARELVGRCDQAWTALEAEIGFFESELSALSQSRTAALDADPALACYRGFLAQVRTMAASRLPADQETILTRLSLSGQQGWQRLAEQLLARIQVPDGKEILSLGAALPSLYLADRADRRRRHAQICRALDREIDLRATVLSMIAMDACARASLRGADWLGERMALDGVTAPEVERLLAVVEARAGLVHRYYLAKKQLLGLAELSDADRYAPLGAPDAARVSWPEACEIVFDVFDGLGPPFGENARKLVRDGCVDARPAPGRRRAAFTRATVPGRPPFLLLNFTGQLRDVLTLAHELGHGIHMMLAGGQPLLSRSPPATMAETVALLSEALTVRSLAARLAGTPELPALLARWLEDQFVTVFRQAAMHRFEMAVHQEAGRGLVLDAEEIGRLWMTTQAAVYGPAVTLSEGYRSWWSYVDSFYTAPGSLYTYVYGQLTALMMLGQLDARGSGFLADYTEMLRSGGSRGPRGLLALAGMPPGELPWSSGLDILAGTLDSFLVLTGQAAAATATRPAGRPGPGTTEQREEVR
jgi:oligoendopeptidase F